MKKGSLTLIALAGILALSGVLSACGSVNASQEINVAVDGSFSLKLDSNPSTGYSWQAEYDESHLELTNRNFVPSSTAVGAGGVEEITFKALKTGETTLTMTYKRVWEATSLKSQVYLVKISGS